MNFFRKLFASKQHSTQEKPQRHTIPIFESISIPKFDSVDPNSKSAILQAIEAFKNFSDKPDHELMDMLEASGMEGKLAEQVIIFLPLAFTRIILSRDPKPIFANTYVTIHPTTGEKKTRQLSEQPIFMGACSYAMQEMHDKNAVSQIALRSSEFNAINKALHAGSAISDLIMSPPTIGAKW